jgi:hypothetical protein
MRIKDLLRMNTGHDQDATGNLRNATKSWAAAFLSLPVEHKPGTHFVYNSAATYMLSAIIQKVTGETLLQYLTPRLFDPLSIPDPTWDSDPDGINVGGWGLNIRTKDIASFGQLYLQNGKWNNAQLISKDWIEEATALQTSNGSNPISDWEQGYGYQFWQCRNNIYRGDGAYGQYCIVMPKEDVVIAITSGTNDMQAILNLIWEFLLPACQDEDLPADESNFLALQKKLSELALSTVEGEDKSSLSDAVSGRTYTMETNLMGIESMVFDLSEERKSVIFTSADETLTLPIGYGLNKKGVMLLPQYGKKPVASSGAWISENNFRVRMYYYETPFYMDLDFIFAENIVTANMEMNVSNRSHQLPPLKGKSD